MKNTTTIDTKETVRRTDHGLLTAASTLNVGDVQYLVDAYYTIQEIREAADKQMLAESYGPHDLVRWLADQNHALEKQISRALDSWTDVIAAARWAKSIAGIGPVISAGLAAHIDVTRCRTVGSIWRFAGLDPTQEWNKGEKLPWNAALKRLCWRIGESFVQISTRENSFYGRLYLQRERQEIAANDAGRFADQARQKLRSSRIRETADDFQHYAQGKLPPAHIHSRAKRWVVKLFLAHYHHVAWTLATGTRPAKPYAISVLGHTDQIMPPNFPEVR